MHFGDFIHNQARKAGIPTDSPELITLLSDKRLSEIQVPDSLAQTIDTKLITEDAAEARLQGKFKGKFYGEALSATDAALLEAATENGVTSERLKELLKEKSTPTNVKAIAKEIADIHKKQASGKGNQDELQKEIERLNQTLSTTLTANKQKESEIINEYEGKLNKLYLTNFWSTFNHDDTKYTNEEFADLASIRLDKLLSERKASYKVDNGNFELLGEGGVPFYDERGNKVSFKDLAAGMLANNKMLKTAEAAKPAGSQAPTFSGNGSAAGVPSHKVMAALDQSLADLG